MAEKQNIPEIRFEGFTDPWEQRKLGELFFESNERSSSMEILSVSVAKGIYPASESNRDTNPGASLANYKVVHKGDVVYNSMRMWQGAVGSSDYDGIVSPAYVVARPVIELDSTCFGYLLKRPEMLYKYLCDSQGNSKDTQTLKYNRFADIEVTMPVNLEEQRVISACLGRVDTLITLHQRKCQYRSLYGYLSWEQRKFSDVAVIRRGLTYSPTNIVDEADGVRVLRSSNINEDHFVLNDDDVFVDEDAVNIDLVHDGDILITAANGSPRLVGKRARISALPGKTVHGGFMLVASSPYSDFLCASMGSSWYRRFLATGVAGGNGAIGNLDSKALEETTIAVPNDAEIDELGNFFTRLDSLITLHQ